MVENLVILALTNSNGRWYKVQYMYTLGCCKLKYCFTSHKLIAMQFYPFTGRLSATKLNNFQFCKYLNRHVDILRTFLFKEPSNTVFPVTSREPCSMYI